MRLKLKKTSSRNSHFIAAIAARTTKIRSIRERDNDTKPFELNKPKMLIITQIGKRNRRKMYFVFSWFALLHQTMTRQNVLHWLEVFRLLKTKPQNISIWLVKQTRWQEQSQMIETNELNEINASTIRWMEFSWRYWNNFTRHSTSLL